MSVSELGPNKSVETDKEQEINKTDDSITDPPKGEEIDKIDDSAGPKGIDEQGLEDEQAPNNSSTTPEKKSESQVAPESNGTEQCSKEQKQAPINTDSESGQQVASGPNKTKQRLEQEQTPTIKPSEQEGGTSAPVHQESDNKGTIGKQSNIAQVVGTVNLFDSAKKSSNDFKDPTKSLPNKPTGLPTFESAKEIEAYFNELKNKRVLLVECFDETILRAATYELVNRTEEHYEKRLLAFEGSELEQTDLHLRIFVNEKIGSGEKLIVVISLKSQRFLDSMFVEEPLSADNIKEELEKNDIMLICFANSEFLQENVVGEKYSNFHFPKWTIPFLPYLLKAHFNDEAKSVEEQILQQRNYGLWDENNSDHEFYGLVYGYLRNGAEQLRKEVEKRKQYEEGQSVKEFLKEIQKVSPKELIQDDDLVKNTVLYVATVFPGLSRRDFDFIVSLLLEDEKTTIEVESTKKTKKGKVKTVRTTEEKDCLEIWKKSQDKILAECHLQVIRSETGSQLIDFSLPYLRGELKTKLEQKSFYLKHYELIKESGLLFNFNVSRNIIDNLINLSVEMAVSDPNYYGGNWLMSVVVEITQFLKSDDIQKPEPNNEADPVIYLLNLLEKLAKEERKQQIRPFIIRFSELIREMLNYPQLQEMIKSFLENLMTRKQYNAVLLIVSGIVRQLRFTSQFDGMYWIRQLLERGDAEAKNEAYKTLLEQAKLSGLRSDELLGRLQTWLPERDLEYNKYTFSNKYAIKFIMDYARNTVSHFKEVHYGTWPSKYPLFANIEDNQDFRQIDLLISWVFHPGMQDTLDALEDDFLKEKNISVNILLADLIEMWFKILYGLDSKKVCPEVLTVLNRLLQQIVLNTDRYQQRELMKRWWERQGSFTEKKRKVPVTERAKRQQLSDERKVILELHQKFKELTKKSIS
jgi:hypothetical protein